jgi:hypothetical protein
MNVFTDQLLLIFLYLLFAIIVVLVVFKIANLPLKAGSSQADRYNAAFGLYLFFCILSLSLFLSEVPGLIHNARGIIKTTASKSLWGETVKLIFIYAGLSLLFWLTCYYISSKSVLLAKKGAMLSLEIAADEKSLVWIFGGVILLLSWMLKSPFTEICSYFLPKTGIPFYR